MNAPDLLTWRQRGAAVELEATGPTQNATDKNARFLDLVSTPCDEEELEQRREPPVGVSASRSSER